MRYLEATPVNAALQSARLWTLYEAEQRAARGLRPGDSLDIETRYDARGAPTSRTLPLAEARTTGANGYALPIVSDDNAIAGLPLDEYALAQQGRGGVDLRGHKDETELDPRLLPKVRPFGSAPISMLRPR
jgi:hypothetical protein